MKDEENATPQHLPIDMAGRIQVKGSHVKLSVRTKSDQVLRGELTGPVSGKTNSMCNPFKAYYLDNHGNLTNGYLLGTENTFIFK